MLGLSLQQSIMKLSIVLNRCAVLLAFIHGAETLYGAYTTAFILFPCDCTGHVISCSGATVVGQFSLSPVE